MSVDGIVPLVRRAGTLVDELEVRRSLSTLTQRMLGVQTERLVAGRFTLLDRIGIGGMGSVYAAFDPELDRPVAIKLLHPSRRDADANDRLLAEARSLARLAHPNVVRVFEVGTFEGRVFLAMELIEGVPWSQWLDEHHDWRDVIRVAVDAGRGVAAAHARGVVHRDFKPANVMVRTDGHVFVLDFGLAQARPRAQGQALDTLEASGPTTTTSAHRIAGTPAYMAPECLSGEVATEASDQFSFCVSVFEALYGCRPFRGSTAYEILHAIESQKLATPTERRRVPRSVRRILLRGLSSAPADRWPTMDTLLEALDQARTPARTKVMVAVVVSLATVALVASAMAAEDPCLARSEAIDRVWNAETQDSLRRSSARVQGTGDSLAVVTTHIDDYVAGWTAAYIDACRQPDDELRPRTRSMTACLEGQLRSLHHATTILRDAEPGVWREARALLPSRKDLNRCREASQTKAPASEPTVDVETLASFETLLDQSRVHARTGRMRRALQLVHAASRLAHDADNDVLRARAYLASGKIYGLFDRDDDAMDALQDAVVHAERSGSVATRLDAIRSLALRQAELGRLDQAEQSVRRVQAAHQRFETRPWRWDDELIALQAIIANERGDTDAALGHAQRRLAFVETHASDDPDAVFNARSLVIEMRIKARETTGLIDVINSLRDDARAQYGPQTRTVAKMWGFASNVHYQRGELDAARDAIRLDIELLTMLEGRNSRSLIGPLNNAAVIDARLGQTDATLGTFERIAAIAGRHRPNYDRQLASATHNAAIVRARRGDYDRALEGMYQAHALRSEIFGRNHAKTVATLPEIAAVLNKLGLHQRARTTLVATIDLELRERGADSLGLFQLRLQLAATLDALGELDDAIEQGELVLSFARQHPERLQPKQRYSAHHNLAILLLQRPNRDRAIRALAILRDADALAEFAHMTRAQRDDAKELRRVAEAQL